MAVMHIWGGFSSPNLTKKKKGKKTREITNKKQQKDENKAGREKTIYTKN